MTQITCLPLSFIALCAGLALSGLAQAADGAGAAKLKAIDTNNDGMISKAEAASHPHLAKNFDAIDTNHDGQLSVDELKAYKAAHPHGAKGAKGFAAADTNHDGQIERSEVANDPKKLAAFDAADTNHDGVVTKDEAKAARAARRAASGAK